ncbi:MAG: hypothetical protein QOD05_2137 [Microbacteriaceae bacterium]|jgi:hypothetical protein|nr:hypothetical protein [Microbacteriaceae bacterium]
MGDITVSGGGSTAVATGELLEHAAGLRHLSVSIDDWQRALRSAPVLPAGRPAPQWMPGDPEPYLLEAGAALHRAAELSSELSGALDRAAENYGWVERTAAGLTEAGGAAIGWATGTFAPLVLLWLLGPAFSAGTGFALSTLVTGSPAASWRNLSSWISRQRGVLSDPAFVAFVRVFVSSVDDTMLGVVGVPLPATLAVDDRGLRWFGVRGAARAVIGLAGPSALKETPVTVRQVSAGDAPATAAEPPHGFTDLADRIPPGGRDAPQLRIEKYETPGTPPRWVVYCGGTIDTGLTPAGEPWDDTSNIHGIAELDPGSVRATLQAMRDAGIKPGDPVLAVGYSQGGIVATDVVRQGGFTNAGLVTFGSPTGQMVVPAGVPNVAVEIREDIVPALGGEPRQADRGGLDRILVRRSIYDEHPPPTDEVVPAHNIRNYRETAAIMDASGEERVTGMRETIADFARGEQASVTLWRADRVEESQTGAARTTPAPGRASGGGRR